MDLRSDENFDKKSVLSSKSAKSSSAKVRDLESEDISLSQLELMANKKKMNKADDISLVSKQSRENVRESTKRSNSSSMSSSSTLNDTERFRLRQKTIARENKNDHIRREKSEFLYKFNKLNVKGKWSSLHLDMNHSLDEIRNEYERVRNEIQNERSVAFFKRMLLLGVQGVEMLNNKFDPVGVDLDGWSEAMGYSMENQEYDEVMSELYEKYKGSGQMSPELRLIFMIISSATMFTISKKITKMESGDSFKSLLGGLMGAQLQGGSQQGSQQSQQQPPLSQFQQGPSPLSQLQQPQQQSFYNHRQFSIPNSSAVKVPNVYDLRASRNGGGSDTSDDMMPSKMAGPTTNYVNGEGLDIDNILKTMNDRKREKELQEVTDQSDVKAVPVKRAGKGRGRPKKGNVSLNF